ncbi:MAG: PAS domain S-box protein [Acidobacteriota bacterium]
MTVPVTPPSRVKRTAFAVAAAYLGVSALYVWFSDRLLSAAVGGSAEALSWAQTAKGWAFVTVTAVALFVTVWRLGGRAWSAAQSEAARHLEQAHRQVLFEHGPDGGLVLDDGRFTVANLAAGALFACRPSELVGLHPWDVSPPTQPDGRESRLAAEQYISATGIGEVTRFPWRHRRLDGSEFDAEISLTVLPGTPTRIAAWVRDISAASDARTRLAEAHERLRLLIEGTPNFFFYVRDLGGTLTYVSPTVATITGRPAEKWIGQAHWFMTDDPANEQAGLASQRHLRGEFDGAPVYVEVRHADGHAVLLEVFEYGVFRDDHLVKLQGIAHDVSERHRMGRIQDALYRISEAAAGARTLEGLFPAIHSVVGSLMPARNLYIALYDPATDLVSFPYFVDEIDGPPPPRRARRGLTEYVIRTGEPLLALPERYEELTRAGEIEPLGSSSVDWLGVPLKTQARTLGVLAVQSYTKGVRYDATDLSILTFVSAQVAMAIERTRVEEAVRTSEQRLRDIVEHSSNMFYSHLPDHTLTYVSPQVRHFLDCEPEEALVRWTEFSTDNPVNRIGFESTQRAIDTGERQPVFELELAGRRGRRIWVEVSEAPVVRDGRTVAVVGALTDITERRRIEEALRESEERYRALVEMSPDGIAVHSYGRVVFANTRGAGILGYSSPEDLIGRPILDFVHQDFHERVRERARLAQDDREGQPLLAEQFVRADGTPVDVEVASIPFTFQGRSAVQVVFRDITERRHVEEHLRQAQKLEAIGQLAGGVAHDFNNLLQALMSTTQLLRGGTADPDRFEATVGELETHIRRGASLTRQLLLFSRREVTKSDRIELNAVVGSASELLRRLVPENIRMVVELAAARLWVDADQGQLEQVLVNLVVNASDAMPAGGVIGIKTGDSGTDEAWFEVSDTGHGIPAELRPHIFEPFFTTKGLGKGTGLGLSVVHGIVTRHGGRVVLDSAPGQGSAFRIVLPLRNEPVAGETAAGQPPAVPVGEGERVLLVEDEDGARQALREALSMLGYRVTDAASAEEAEVLAESGEIDVLLTDLILPGATGTELASRLKARFPDLEIITMSGYAEDESVRRSVRDGGIRFLQKPFDASTLASELRAALNRRQGNAS